MTCAQFAFAIGAVRFFQMATAYTIVVRLFNKLSMDWSRQIVRRPCVDCTDNLKEAFYGNRTEPVWFPCRGCTNLWAIFPPKIDSFLHSCDARAVIVQRPYDMSTGLRFLKICITFFLQNHRGYGSRKIVR